MNLGKHDNNKVKYSKSNYHLSIKDLDKKLRNKDTFSILIYDHTCPPCKKEIQVLKKSQIYSKIYLLDLEKSTNKPQYKNFKKLNIEYTPTILKIYQGNVVERQEGFADYSSILKMKLDDFKVYKKTITGTFKAINLNQFKKLKKQNNDFIVYIGRPTCPDCKSFENEFLKLNLNKISSSKISLFYLNVDEIHKHKSIWESFKKSNKIFGTPAFVHYHNKLLVSSSSWTIQNGYNTEKAYNWLLKQIGT